MKYQNALLGFGLVLGTVATAWAHSGATGVVKERMDGMSAMGNVVKALAPIMRGDQLYDAAAIRTGAAAIREHAGESMTRLFSEGSGGMPSAAKEAVWEDWGTFQELAEQLLDLSDGLAIAADNGLMAAPGKSATSTATMGTETMMGTGSMMGSDAMMGGSGSMAVDMMDLEDLAEMPVDMVFNMVSQTCSACHTKFRVEAN